MRIGTARVRTAGVNLPITHPEYRGRGLMAQAFARSLAEMRVRCSASSDRRCAWAARGAAFDRHVPAS
jgi:hypothetical protein